MYPVFPGLPPLPSISHPCFSIMSQLKGFQGENKRPPIPVQCKAHVKGCQEERFQDSLQLLHEADRLVSTKELYSWVVRKGHSGGQKDLCRQLGRALGVYPGLSRVVHKEGNVTVYYWRYRRK